MVDVLNERGSFGGGVVVVQTTRGGKAAALTAQDGLYTVVLRGCRAGRIEEERRLVTSVRRGLDPYAEWPEVVRCFQNPDLRFVLSNTTEAGIADLEEPFCPGCCPESFPAKVAALLYERFRVFSGRPEAGVVFLPCELIERNGATLRQCVLRHAQRWGLEPAFAHWLEADCWFLNTLVDRIVTGFPRQEAAQLAAELGYVDELLVVGEPYHLWVIEGPAALAEEIPFHRAGLNVVWTDNLEPYRIRKVRILNGAHTLGAAAALLAGLDTVEAMVADPAVGAFVRRTVEEEIVPTVPLDAAACREYAGTVLERFANPHIRHELVAIALNSVAKWRVRVLPSLVDYTREQRRPARRLAFSLAALIRFHRTVAATPGATGRVGRRDGGDYPIRDDAGVLAVLDREWASFAAAPDFGWLARRVLGQGSLWGMDLNDVPELATLVARDLEAIERLGMRRALTPLAL
jgi:tagaturonate reductase